MSARTQWIATIARLSREPRGMRTVDLAAAMWRTVKDASNAIHWYQTDHADRLITVRWAGSKALRYCATQVHADTCVALDPVLRVIRNRDGDVRVSLGKRVIDMPAPMARRLARELAEVTA
jgi:hypothetical protein